MKMHYTATEQRMRRAQLLVLGGKDVADIAEKAAEAEANGQNARAANLFGAARDLCWERLHSGPWHDVPTLWRESYVDLTVSLVNTTLHKEYESKTGLRVATTGLDRGAPESKSGSSRKRRRKMSAKALVAARGPSKKRPRVVAGAEPAIAKTRACECIDAQTMITCLGWVDKALMMSPPHCRARLLSLARNLHSRIKGRAKRGREPWPKPRKVAQPNAISDTVSVETVLEPPSLLEFEKRCLGGARPMLMRGGVAHWPATEKWPDMTYLRSMCGCRNVPVEVGDSYLDAKWSQKIMTVDELIDRHIRPRAGRGRARAVGYLAQYPLFDQVPELAKDILVPDYCALADGESVRINAWLGPQGTVSPLHYDPEHNLLAQVVGRKRILLFPPSDSCRLYPAEGRMLQNTSQIDPEVVDATRFPLAADLRPIQAVLEPGDMLYIPPGWWHHVRSLSPSFSVSFWFGGSSAPQLGKRERKSSPDGCGGGDAKEASSSSDGGETTQTSESTQTSEGN